MEGTGRRGSTVILDVAQVDVLIRELLWWRGQVNESFDE
jgi:hypothetical protein